MNRLEEMIPLTRKEIYTELKKLGINTTPELKSYLREYHTYYVHPKINTSSPGKFTTGIEDNQPNQSTLHDRFSQIDSFK
jgi:hypothetical protein